MFLPDVCASKPNFTVALPITGTSSLTARLGTESHLYRSAVARTVCQVRLIDRYDCALCTLEITSPMLSLLDDVSSSTVLKYRQPIRLLRKSYAAIPDGITSLIASSVSSRVVDRVNLAPYLMLSAPILVYAEHDVKPLSDETCVRCSEDSDRPPRSDSLSRALKLCRYAQGHVLALAGSDIIYARVPISLSANCLSSRRALHYVLLWRDVWPIRTDVESITSSGPPLQ
ncbi:hypothetical protein Tco_0628501 [Tanacetum coccineum]|uniref:Uncharacterized protein n=1 Tax=Tanacetum coccineum TaxID=301880 RepID=A0ABQ4WQI7_9ASTR